MNRTSARRAAKLALLQLGMAVTLALPAVAGPAVSLQASAQKGGGPAETRVDVLSTAGRYDRISGSKLSLVLRLAAEMTSEGAGAKIVASDLFLKQVGSGKDAAPVSAMDGQGPQRAVRLEQPFSFPIDPLGPVAQNAISACNSLSHSSQSSSEVRETTMTVPVLWRVVTGRFNYKWVTYDRVASADEISQNLDFYADRAAEEIETSARVTVACAPVVAAVATKSQVKPASKTEVAEKIAVDEKPLEPVKPVAARHETAPVVTKASVTAPANTVEKPVCRGGFIRQMQSGDVSYLCLCPGNTQRVESGTNAYSCERRSGRSS